MREGGLGGAERLGGSYSSAVCSHGAGDWSRAQWPGTGCVEDDWWNPRVKPSGETFKAGCCLWPEMQTGQSLLFAFLARRRPPLQALLPAWVLAPHPEVGAGFELLSCFSGSVCQSRFFQSRQAMKSRNGSKQRDRD